jgi:hypothetical protein
MFKRKKNVHRHGPRTQHNIYHLADPPHFSLYSVYTLSLTWHPCKKSAILIVSVCGRKIRLIEYNAKCRFLKKLTCKVTLRQMFYLSEGPLLSYEPIPPHTHCILVYSIIIHTGNEGRRANQREGSRGNSSQSRSKIPTRLTVSLINSLKHQQRRHLGFGVFTVN